MQCWEVLHLHLSLLESFRLYLVPCEGYCLPVSFFSGFQCQSLQIESPDSPHVGGIHHLCESVKNGVNIVISPDFFWTFFWLWKIVYLPENWGFFWHFRLVLTKLLSFQKIFVLFLKKLCWFRQKSSEILPDFWGKILLSLSCFVIEF